MRTEQTRDKLTGGCAGQRAGAYALTGEPVSLCGEECLSVLSPPPSPQRTCGTSLDGLQFASPPAPPYVNRERGIRRFPVTPYRAPQRGSPIHACGMRWVSPTADTQVCADARRKMLAQARLPVTDGAPSCGPPGSSLPLRGPSSPS